jgi:hypothetical protein
MSWYMAHKAYSFPKASRSLGTTTPHVFPLVGVVGSPGPSVARFFSALISGFWHITNSA